MTIPSPLLYRKALPVLAAVVLMTNIIAPSFADEMILDYRMIQTQVDEILDLLEPLNIEQVEQRSTEVFEDFLKAKDALRGYQTPTENTSSHS